MKHSRASNIDATERAPVSVPHPRRRAVKGPLPSGPFCFHGSDAFGTTNACGGLSWFVERLSCVPTPLVPSQAFDVTVYIVLNDFGPLGRAYCETDEAEADETTIVENILNGQYSHPLRVVAFNTAEGWAEDVTEDIAIAVLSRARSEHRLIGKVAQGFVEKALGAKAFMGD